VALDAKEDITETLTEIVTELDGQPGMVTRWAIVCEYIDIETEKKGLCYVTSPECEIWDAKTLFEVGVGIAAKRMQGRS